MSRSPKVLLRGDGRYQAQVQINKRRVTLYGATKREVEEKLNQLLLQARVDGGLPEKHTLFELLDQFLQTGEGTWKPRTLHDYHRYAKIIRDELGDLPLKRVTPSRLQSLYSRLKGIQQRPCTSKSAWITAKLRATAWTLLEPGESGIYWRHSSAGSSLVRSRL